MEGETNGLPARSVKARSRDQWNRRYSRRRFLGEWNTNNFV